MDQGDRGFAIAPEMTMSGAVACIALEEKNGHGNFQTKVQLHVWLCDVAGLATLIFATYLRLV